MLVDDALGQRWPGLLLPYVIKKLSNAGRRHVINNDVWLGSESLEEVGHVVKVRNLPAIVCSDGGPKKQVTALIAQALQCLSCAVQKLAVRIDKREVHIHEDVGVFHARASDPALIALILNQP